MYRNRYHRAPGGFTLIELLVVMAIIGLLLSLLMPAVSRSRAMAKLSRDGVHIRAIHQAWLIWSGEFGGSLPLPGLINRLPDPLLGNVPGRGPEDLKRNTHAALYSASICFNYFTPQICVGATEVSGRVFMKDDYNYERCDPSLDSYWDPSFIARLETVGSNLSFSQPPLCGDRKVRRWREIADPTFAVIGNRGPRGADTASEAISNMLQSATVELHGGRKQWVGQVCYNDNHTVVEDSLWPEGITDHLFNNDEGDNEGPAACAGQDNFLTICSQMQISGGIETPKLEWD